MFTELILALLSGSIVVQAQAATIPEYGQCGGSGYTGSTTCAAGLTCYCQNQYYSECLAQNPGWTGCSGSTPPTNPSPTTNPSPSASPSSPPVNPGTCSVYTGEKNSGHYWDGQKGACGCGTGTGGGTLYPWQESPGPGLFTAASSQNLFDGAGSTASYCGTGCGTCYNVTNLGYIAAQGQGDCTGAGESITVMVTNLCPANGNQQWCAQPTNEYNYSAHFDIMQASSSAGGPMGWNNPVVSYEPIACPSTLVQDYSQCTDCAGPSRVRRGLSWA
ncbi:hypothetical protein P7C71_g2460, partial [Lecanoromycetidae sp. Uapishka_2]